MRDTPPEIEQKFRGLLLQRSGEERLKMGGPCTPRPRPWSAPPLRFYGRDFDPEARQKILLALEKSSGSTRQINGEKSRRK